MASKHKVKEMYTIHTNENSIKSCRHRIAVFAQDDECSLECELKHTQFNLHT